MLMLNQLVGFGVGTEGSISITYADSAVDATNGTSFSFAGRSVQAAAANRKVVVSAVVRISSGVAGKVSAVTVGGVAATEVVQTAAATVSTVTSLWVLDFQTGTTATVAVTTDQISLCCGIGIWAMYGAASSTATGTITSNADPGSMTLSLPAGGAIIAASASGADATATWTGATKNFDATVEAATTCHSGASSVSSSNPSCDWTAASNPRSVAASWAP